MSKKSRKINILFGDELISFSLDHTRFSVDYKLVMKHMRFPKVVYRLDSPLRTVAMLLVSTSNREEIEALGYYLIKELGRTFKETADDIRKEAWATIAEDCPPATEENSP